MVGNDTLLTFAIKQYAADQVAPRYHIIDCLLRHMTAFQAFSPLVDDNMPLLLYSIKQRAPHLVPLLLSYGAYVDSFDDDAHGPVWHVLTASPAIFETVDLDALVALYLYNAQDDKSEIMKDDGRTLIHPDLHAAAELAVPAGTPLLECRWN